MVKTLISVPIANVFDLCSKPFPSAADSQNVVSVLHSYNTNYPIGKIYHFFPDSQTKQILLGCSYSHQFTHIEY